MIGRLREGWIRLKTVLNGTPVIGLLFRAIVRDVKQHSKDMAASIAFFGMLSVFPMILGMVALASNVLKSEQFRLKVMEWVNELFPVGADFVTQNIESLIRLRGTAGLASVLVLLWSAKKMVGAISRGINRSLDLHLNLGHALLLSPLRNFAIVVLISVLMFASTAITPIAELLSGLDLTPLTPKVRWVIEITGGRLTSLLITATMLAVTYTLVPYKRPAWKDLVPGLVTAVVLIELGKLAFVYYVENVSKLDALYGSISTFIMLMLWLYFVGRSMLFGGMVIRTRQKDRLSVDGAENLAEKT